MAYLISPSDINTIIYQVVVDEITQSDTTKVTNAIATAIGEASLYISRFNVPALMGTPTTDPTYIDPLLKQYCVNIACWYIVLLCNTDMNFEHIRLNYKYTIDALKMIQSGKAQPAGWPYLDTTGETAPPGDSIYSHSNYRRQTHF